MLRVAGNVVTRHGKTYTVELSHSMGASGPSSLNQPSTLPLFDTKFKILQGVDIRISTDNLPNIFKYMFMQSMYVNMYVLYIHT